MTTSLSAKNAAAIVDAWDLKLLGYILLMTAIAPVMMNRHDGRIVNIINGGGRTPRPNFLVGGTMNAVLSSPNFTFL